LIDVYSIISEIEQVGYTVEVDIWGRGRPEFIIRIGDAGLVTQIDGTERSRSARFVAVVETDYFVVAQVLHSM